MGGVFITLEGGEGVGKSTQIPLIKDYLQQQGRQVITLREPGNTPIAEEIRQILKTYREDEVLYPETELLLMYAARTQLIRKVIKPALESGIDVLCDRHDLSSLAYQGGGHGLPLSAIEACRNLALAGIRPDLTLLLDLDPGLGMARVVKRGALDRFERLSDPFRERVRQAYLDYARQHPQIVKVIDASQSPEAVFTEIRGHLEGLYSHVV